MIKAMVSLALSLKSLAALQLPPPLLHQMSYFVATILHALFRVSSLSAVEGYFFADYPARVCSTLHELVAPYPHYIFPLPCQTKVPRNLYTPPLAAFLHARHWMLIPFLQEQDGGNDAETDTAREDESINSQDLVFSPELFISIFFHLDLPSLARVALVCFLASFFTLLKFSLSIPYLALRHASSFSCFPKMKQW